jgi:hypothetical protein
VLLSTGGGPHQRLSDHEAVRAALRNPGIAADVRGRGHVDTDVRALDDQLTRVDFSDGPRLFLSVALTPAGKVRAVEYRAPGRGEFGSKIARNPALLVLLAVAFLAASLTLPLLSLRNADAVALAAFALIVWMFNENYVRAGVFTAAALLAWTAIRCALTAVRPAAVPGRLAIDGLATRLGPAERRRIGAAVAGALALAFVIVTVTSTGESDIAFASVAGATRIIDGGVPYGHLPHELLHGDTYPFLAYVSYVPGALLVPVHDSFDDLTGSLLVAAVAAIVAAVAIARVHGRLRGPIMWLAFPPLLVTASAGRNDVVAAALVAWALALPAAAACSSTLLGAAAWVKLAPVAALPVWLARFRGRELYRAIAGVAILSLAALALLVALGGTGAVGDMADALTFQLQRGSPFSLWAQLGFEAGQRICQAAVISGIVVATLATMRDRALAADLRRVAGMCAAILVGLQLSANYWTYAYLVWAFPFIAFALLPTPRRSQPSALHAP